MKYMVYLSKTALAQVWEQTAVFETSRMIEYYDETKVKYMEIAGQVFL